MSWVLPVATLQEYAALSELNDVLQQRARQVHDLRNKGRPAVAGGLSQLDGAETRYRSAAGSASTYPIA